MKKKEIVYVLKNESMPGLIKIGITQQDDMGQRLQTLYTTGVPFPFECLWAGEVDNCHEIEILIHNAFKDSRINPKREFFKLDANQIIPLLKKLSSADVTPHRVEKMLNGTISSAEKDAAKQFHRPMLNFEALGISRNSKLIFTEDESVSVEVIAPKKVQYKGKDYSLSNLTKNLLNLPYYVAPCHYWTFKGKNLQDIYDETYPMK